MYYSIISKYNRYPRILNKYLTRGLSYVERVRFLQRLKEQDRTCLSYVPSGKFLAYCRSKPLIRVDEANTDKAIVWLNYSEIKNYAPDILHTSVLLDVADDGTPRYSVQLGELQDPVKDKLEDETSGFFTDLRAALFMVTWREAHILSRANCVLMWNRNTAFCGKCGSKTERNAAGYSRKCTGCGMTHYPSSNPVGIVLITDKEHENAILVRQPRHPRGMYSCIAGFSDIGESLEETVRREVAEEVGLEATDVRYIASQHWPFPGSLMTGCFAVCEKEEIK